VLVAAQDEEAVGVVAVRPGWLDGLYVVPDAWGSGVAGSLHDAGLDHLRALGEVECRLWVLEENARARRFYEHRGWELNGTTRVVPYPPNPLDVGYSIRL
jgi:GNAT superfamily N-acetyltransferase